MDPKYELINHNGKEIIYFDFGGMSEVEGIENVKRTTPFLINYGKNKEDPVLVLVDMRNYAVSSKHMDTSKNEGKITNKAVPNNKIAVLSVKGIRKILLKSYNTITGNKMTPFDTKEQALDWLVTN